MAARHFKEPTEPEPKKPRPRRATTPEGREQQMIALAVDVAEDMMRSGNPPAQVVTHYLKIGSTRERVELDLKREEIEVAKMRRETMAAAQRIESVYEEALAAMKFYKGGASPEGEYYEE
jgi:hypothetical protein